MGKEGTSCPGLRTQEPEREQRTPADNPGKRAGNTKEEGARTLATARYVGQTVKALLDGIDLINVEKRGVRKIVIHSVYIVVVNFP